MNTQVPFVIISADRPGFTPEVLAMRRDTFEHQLRARDLDFKRMLGMWEGVQEVSYLVLIPHPYDEHSALRLARRYGQESALYVDANRHATVMALNAEDGGPDVKESIGLGVWQETTPDLAVQQPAYTKDPENEQYYIVR